MLDRRDRGEARGEQNLEPRAKGLRRLCQFAAGHAARHDHIGEQKVDRRSAAQHGQQRLGSVARLDRLVAEIGETPERQAPQRVVILDHQHAFRRGAPVRAGSAGAVDGATAAAALRQIEVDLRAAAEDSL